MAYTTTWETSGVVVTKFVGDFSAEDVLDATCSVHQHSMFDSIRVLVNDFSEVTSVPDKVAASVLEDLVVATTSESLYEHCLEVAIITSNRLIEDLSVFYLEAANKDWKVNVFASAEQARTWMGALEFSGKPHSG